MIDYLQAALDRSPGNYTIEDVKRMIRSNDVRLWPNHKSAAVTEEVKAFNIWLAGGDMGELFEMLDAAEAEHRARGFDQVTISEARKGWKRVLKARGYVERVVLVKEL